MKKVGILLALLLVASVFVSGCASNNENKGNVSGNTSGAQGATAIETLNFGYQPSTHQIAYMTAKTKGWWQKDLAPYGIKNIQEKPAFPQGGPEMISMKDGELDVAYVGAAPAVAAISRGLDAKIVSAAQINGSSLVIRPDLPYNSPKDLKGLTIATFGAPSIQDTLLRKWLKENGLDPEKDVTIIAMDGGPAATAISSKKVDAVFLPHPTPTILEKAGKGRIIVQSGQMEPNHVCCVVLVSGKLIREHPDIVEQIVKTHINATEYNKAHIDEAAQIFANYTSNDVENVTASLKEWDGEWITDPTQIENSTVDFSNTLLALNNTYRPLSKDDIFDTSFYEKAVNST